LSFQSPAGAGGGERRVAFWWLPALAVAPVPAVVFPVAVALDLTLAVALVLVLAGRGAVVRMIGATVGGDQHAGHHDRAARG
jgi:hypothetical protein